MRQKFQAFQRLEVLSRGLANAGTFSIVNQTVRVYCLVGCFLRRGKQNIFHGDVLF